MKSLKEFRILAESRGQLANPPPNNKYPGQCVSLVQQCLYIVFNMPFKSYGNAKDWINNVPKGFVKLSPGVALLPGDILVYGANYGGGFGHIGLIDDEGKWLDQNGIVSLKIARRNTPFLGYICVLRPTMPFEVDNSPTLVDIYVVQKNDNLSKIAQKQGCKWPDIASVNGLKEPYTIYIGQVLRLPVQNTNNGITKGSKVKVKSGAKTFTGGGLANSVYSKVYDVIEIKGNRVVIGLGKTVTAAMNISDLIKI